MTGPMKLFLKLCTADVHSKSFSDFALMCTQVIMCSGKSSFWLIVHFSAFNGNIFVSFTGFSVHLENLEK